MKEQNGGLQIFESNSMQNRQAKRRRRKRLEFKIEYEKEWIITTDVLGILSSELHTVARFQDFEEAFAEAQVEARICSRHLLHILKQQGPLPL